MVFAFAGVSGTLATQARVPQVRVVNAVLTDDGDGDGWADTRETVAMRVTVRNLTGVNLTGLVLLVSTDDPAIAAITDNRIVIGDLADGASRLSDEAFEFVVGEVDRTDVAQSLSVRFRFRSYADQYYIEAFEGRPCPTTPIADPAASACGAPAELTLDLDLDASGGGAPTTFFEGFESGFGQFTTMHLDETLNPPPGDILNHLLGVVAADGWRCQYADPDWEVAMSYNNAQGLVCYPSQNGVPDTYYWHLAPERAFTGEQSLHYGVFLDPAALYTTPRANLEAIRTIDPINLGWANVCSVSRTTFCSTASDCPAGETCEPATPRFTFKHQISMIDGRSIGSGPNLTRQWSADRGIVAGQLASDSDGSPLGPWARLEPYVNVYDTQANTNYFNCTFDPADDGSTEEDFFDPADPLRSLGPSSMCYPNYSFTYQGSTVEFDTSPSGNPARLGKASDGPGLLGAKGPGTWVEPVFDLSRFRGRRLRLRFVTTGLKAGSAPLWHPGFVDNTAANPDPRDDGWFIDDVRMTDVLAAPAAPVPDTKDNDELPGLDDPDGDAAPVDNCPLSHNPDQADADGDGVGDVCDDCPLDTYDDRYGAGVCCPASPEDDADGDGRCGAQDTCPGRFNPGGGGAYRVAAQASTGLLTADGQRVVYIAAGDLYSVPMTGGAASLLHARTGTEHTGVRRLGQTPDGATVVFTADSVRAGRMDLYTVPVTGGATQLLGGSVDQFLVAPDGAWIVYTTFARGLFAVPIGGGPVETLLAATDFAAAFAISADGSIVVYSSGGLWAVPIGGGRRWALGPPAYENRFVISGDGMHVVYRADQGVAAQYDLYAVPIGGGTPQKLDGPLPSGGDVTSAFQTTPDGSQVLYVADEDVDEVFELYRVQIDGTARTRMAPGVSWTTDSRSTPKLSIVPDGSRAVLLQFTGNPRTTELYSVELAGGPLEHLASSVSLAGNYFLVAPDSSTVVLSNYSDRGIYAVPTAGGASIPLAGIAAPRDVLSVSAISPDSVTVLYHSNDPVMGGLYLVPLVLEKDDGDGLTFPCDCDPDDAAVHADAPEVNDGVDNQCPGGAGWGMTDELAGDAVFDTAGTFAWTAQPGATMYEVARAATPDFGMDCAVATTADPWWTDPEVPAEGSAFYYLSRTLEPNAGSWGVDSAGNERGPLCP